MAREKLEKFVDGDGMAFVEADGNPRSSNGAGVFDSASRGGRLASAESLDSHSLFVAELRFLRDLARILKTWAEIGFCVGVNCSRVARACSEKRPCGRQSMGKNRADQKKSRCGPCP